MKKIKQKIASCKYEEESKWVPPLFPNETHNLFRYGRNKQICNSKYLIIAKIVYKNKLCKMLFKFIPQKFYLKCNTKNRFILNENANLRFQYC